MKSERREWHCGLFFAGLILTIPALFSLLPASASSGWGISHIHAALLGGTTALLTAALASAYGREICLQKRFAWLAYGLLSGGMVILALESIGIGVDPWVSIAAGFVLGAGKAWAFLLWARLFSWLPLASMLAHSSAACLFAGVLAWLVMGLRAEWVIAVAVAVPFILATAYAYSCSVLSFDSSRKEYDVKFQKVGRLPWRPIIIMALVGFVAALGPIATFGITVTLEEVALLPMGALTLGFLIWVKAFRSEYLLKAAFAVYGVGFLLPLVHSEWSILAGFIVSMSYWGMALFVFWFLCNDVREKKSPTGWTFGVSFALLDIMQLVGYVLPQMGLVVPSANEGGALGVFTIAAIALAVAGAALWATEHVGQGHWSRQFVGSNVTEASHSARPGESELAFRCRMSGQARGLTFREEEILVLLLERNTINQIAHQLFLSGNTVKTHVKHIYGKMGVHNRDELRAAVLGS